MTRSLPQRTRTIIAIASLSMASFGIVLTALGASLHTLIARFGLDKSQAGALLSLQSFWVLAGSLVFGPIVDRRGYKGVLLLAFAAMVAGLEIIAFAPSLLWLRTGIVLVSFSGGIVNGAVNALVADVSAEQRGAALNFVGAFFGVGAAGVPFALSALAGDYSTAVILAVIAGFVVIPFVLTATTSFPPPKQPHTFPMADARRLVGSPVLLLMGVVLFLQSGMETTVGGWTSLLFVEELNVTTERAPTYLALFWLGLMLSRLALGLLHSAVTVRSLLISSGAALVSSLVLILTRNVVVAATAVFCLGASFAPMFPVIFGFVGDRFAHLSGTALSIVMAMALCGGMLMPYVTGVLGDAFGLRVSFAIVPVALLALALLLGVLARLFSASPTNVAGERAVH
jgi:FHS family glucose/mannose:H+ symporter-like MFS transporter